MIWKLWRHQLHTTTFQKTISDHVIQRHTTRSVNYYQSMLDSPNNVSNMQPNEIMGAVRPIHMSNAFTQIVVRHIERNTKRAEAHYSQFGARPGRRREEAIAIQNINRFRCMQNNVSYAQKVLRCEQCFLYH